ncbi:MAG: zinc ABC transporter substrate-binding protein [Pseudolabrys sp.]|nr:zinc ABC transporter substrate-binding protein [Pseudolabrys sp.]
MRVHIAAALLALLVMPLAGAPAQAADGKIAVVAAENFYGEIARDIGGAHVTVTSIMSNPDQDPHLFETTPGVVKQIADAQIVILNGADYDPWMPKLMQAAPRPNRVVINAGEIVGAKTGGNPHLWYAPATMPAVAKAIAAAFSKADSAHAADYAANLDKTLAQLERVTQRVGQLRDKHKGKAVTATEPVFGLMAEAVGLTMRNEKFQLAMMNDTEPSARDIAAFENDLKNHKVKALIYNKQVSEKLTERLLTVAKKAKVPVVAVTETKPEGVSFADWMVGELDALDKALDGANS